VTIGRQNDEINVAATKPVNRMIGTAACIEAHQLEERDFAPPAAPLSVGALGEATGSFLLVAGPRGWRGDAPHPTPRRQIF